MTRATQYTRYTQILGPANAEPIVLLPGFTGSHRMWSRQILALSTQYRRILVDPLGFGRSPKPHIADTLDDHLAALDTTLCQLNVARATIIGYSMGSLLALAYAAYVPEQTSRLVLIALPYYRNEQEALAIVAGSSLLNRLLTVDTPLARFTCRLMCQFRPLFEAIAPVLARDVPAVVARDALLHTWSSYSRTQQHVICEAQSSTWFRTCQTPVRLLHGVHDHLAPLSNLLATASHVPNIRLVTFAAQSGRIAPTQIASRPRSTTKVA